jgi:hypothetical protein
VTLKCEDFIQIKLNSIAAVYKPPRTPSIHDIIKKISTARCQWLTPVTPATQEAGILKIPITKRAGGVAQLVEYLSSKREALSTTKTSFQVSVSFLSAYSLFKGFSQWYFTRD